jgi:hypothetical protein
MKIERQYLRPLYLHASVSQIAKPGEGIIEI